MDNSDKSPLPLQPESTLSPSGKADGATIIPIDNDTAADSTHLTKAAPSHDAVAKAAVEQQEKDEETVMFEHILPGADPTGTGAAGDAAGGNSSIVQTHWHGEILHVSTTTEGSIDAASDKQAELRKQKKENWQKRLTFRRSGIAGHVGSVSDTTVPLFIHWERISYAVNTGRKENNQPVMKTILKDISGEVFPGEIIAIVSSGDEGTALLNILTGRIRHGTPSGVITVNNEPRKPNWLRIVGFVEKETMLFSNLTPREMFMFVAKLKSSGISTDQERAERVDQVIEKMKITSIADKYAKHLTPTEAKRVSVGIEMMTNPRLLFLDEPTANMDPFDTLRFIRDLKQLTANDHRTVIMTCKQLNAASYKLFSKVLVLSEGITVFYGHYDKLQEHLQRLSLPQPRDDLSLTEMISDICSRPDDMREKLLSLEPTPHSRPLNENPIVKLDTQWTVSYYAEIKMLMKREFLEQFRDRNTLIFMLFVRTVITLLFSFVFFQMAPSPMGIKNRTGLLTYITTYSVAVQIWSSPKAFDVGRKLLIRERYVATYRPVSYLVAKVVSLLPYRWLLTILFALPTYYITGLRTDHFYHFLIFLAMFMVQTVATISIALLVNSSTENSQISKGFNNIYMLFCTVFGGYIYYIPSVTWILRWIQYISITFYTHRGLVVNELENNWLDDSNGSDYLAEYYWDELSFPAAIGGLFGLAMIQFVITFFIIRHRSKPRIVLL